MQQLFDAISSVLYCIIKSTWVTSNSTIAKDGQKLKVHFLVEKWLCLGDYLGKKSKAWKSFKHVIFRELNDSESNTSIFWIIQNHKTEVGIFHEPLKLCGWFFQGRYSSSISLISIKLFSSHMYFLITGSFIMAKKTQKSRQWGSLQAHYFMNRSNILAHFFRVVSP